MSHPSPPTSRRQIAQKRAIASKQRRQLWLLPLQLPSSAPPTHPAPQNAPSPVRRISVSLVPSQYPTSRKHIAQKCAIASKQRRQLWLLPLQLPSSTPPTHPASQNAPSPACGTSGTLILRLAATSLFHLGGEMACCQRFARGATDELGPGHHVARLEYLLLQEVAEVLAPVETQL